MSLICSLAAFGLRQVLGDGVENVASAVQDLFRDHSQTLPRAIQKAHDRAWQSLGVALAGDGMIDRVKVFFSGPDEKGIREQVATFLQSNAISFAGTPNELRAACLDELKRLRKSGLLSSDGMPAAEVAKQAGGMRRHADGPGLVEGATWAVGQVADILTSDYQNLAQLLRTATPAGPPLLAAAFCFFFRREVETDDELAHGLFFDGLRQLTASQARGFVEVGKALATLGDRFDEVLGQLGRIEVAVGEVHATTQATHGAVLDIQAELQRLGGLHLAGVEEVRTLLVQVQYHLGQVGMHQGQLRPEQSCSIRGEEERRAVRALLSRFRDLAADERRKVPALINGLGKLQMGTGDFAEARETFLEVARTTPDVVARAEACSNAYRAALEQKHWEEALAALRQAATLDPGRHAPFPLHRYEPKRILGAGGFGTAVLCLDKNFDEEVVVKTLHAGDLERGLEEVFREARALRCLSHPAVIAVRDCEHADPIGQARPYIVMDFFPGVSLEAFVQEHGPLSPDDLLAVATQVARGMQAAHGSGIFHRDLKPDNVLVRKEGNGWRVKIIDFGLALRRQVIETSVARASAAEETALGRSVAGTVLYAPPEQMGRMPGVRVGPYSDVFAFGKTCCFALFRTTEPRSRHLASLSAELRELLEGCIEQELEHRLADFDEVLAVLEALQPISQKGSRQLPTHQEPIKPIRKVPRSPESGDLTDIPLGNGVVMRFAWIPPGTFLMGSPEARMASDRNGWLAWVPASVAPLVSVILMGGPVGEAGRNDDEMPHRVTLTRGYRLGVYPVTRGQFARFVETTGYVTQAERNGGAYIWIGSDWKLDPSKSWRSPGFEQGDDHPVVCVSWNDCEAFCRWLTDQDRGRRRFRLPTEAEWEHACRAGTTTPFHFGETISTDLANYDGDYIYGKGRKGTYRGETTPVGSFQANAWGLHDMHGNIWEWCSDWYGPYPTEDTKDPQGDNDGTDRVLRGGSWYDDPKSCRSAFRHKNEPDSRNNVRGCRVVLCLD